MKRILSLIFLLITGCTTSTQNDKVAQLRARLSIYHLLADDLEKAEQNIHCALRYSHSVPETYLALAMYKSRIGHLLSAESAYKKALSLAPTASALCYHYAYFLYQQKQFHTAYHYFERARQSGAVLFLQPSLVYQVLCAIHQENRSALQTHLKDLTVIDPQVRMRGWHEQFLQILLNHREEKGFRYAFNCFFR